MKVKITNRKYALVLIPDVDMALRYIGSEKLIQYNWNVDNIVYEVRQEEIYECYRVFFALRLNEHTSFQINHPYFPAVKAELLGSTPLEENLWGEILSTFDEKQQSDISPSRKYLVFKITDYNGIKRFVVDPANFNGYPLDSMTEGIHCDYCMSHSTLEEMRQDLINWNLITVNREELENMEADYIQSLCKPFEEITEERYWQWLEYVPPKRFNGNRFFVGECYTHSLHHLCFCIGEKYYAALRSIHLTDAELSKEINDFSEALNK